MNILNSAVTAVLGAALNTLWQTLAATALLWLALRYSRLTAAARHGVCWLWLVVLALILAAPQGRKVERAMPVSAPIEVSTPIFVAPVSPPAMRGPMPAPVQVRAKSGPLVLLALWLLLAFLQFARLAWSFLHLRSLKRHAQPAAPDLAARLEAWTAACGVRRPVHLLVSNRLASPMAVGFLQPAVILPEALMQSLSTEELDHVLLHELAHVARRDDWTNLWARMTAALVGWHPAAAWVLNRIGRERELACDEWVVAATGAPRPYARSLARLFELCRTGRREVLATGMAGRGSNLGERIEMLVRRSPQRASLFRVAACLAVLFALIAAGIRAPRWVAFAQDAPRHAAPASPLPPPNPQSFLASLVAAGYGDLPVDDIIALKNHGVTPEFLRGISRSGWTKLSPQQLIDLREHGVSTEYLRDMHESGVRDLNVQGVIEMRTHGVSPEYARELNALGFGPYTAGQVINFAAQGVHVELFRALKESGFTKLAPEEIVEAHHSGVGSRNLQEAKQYGANLSLAQIIKLKRAGVI